MEAELLYLLALAASSVSIPAPLLDPPEITSLEEAWDRAPNSSEASRKEAMAITGMRSDNWELCLRYYQHEFQASRDDPDYVATAVIQSCRDHEARVTSSIIRGFYGLMDPVTRQQKATEITASYRSQHRQEIIAYLVRYHLEQNNRPPPANSVKAPAAR